MHETLSSIEECVRVPSPCPPHGLACDGPHLWVGCRASRRIYGIDARNGRVFEEAIVPGEPFGIAVTGDALRVIVADENDDRYLCRYVMGKDFKRSDRIPLPDMSGSSLAYDGDALYVCQRHERKIVEIDGRGRTIREIATPTEVVGMTIVGGCFYLLASDEADEPAFTLARLDARGATPEIVELAAVPFKPRALAFDGRRFWAPDAGDNSIVAFARPDDAG